MVRYSSAAAAFFTAIFPGNVAQLVDRRDGFGLYADTRCALRLLGQPLLVAWAVWCTRTSRRAGRCARITA